MKGGVDSIAGAIIPRKIRVTPTYPGLPIHVLPLIAQLDAKSVGLMAQAAPSPGLMSVPEEKISILSQSMHQMESQGIELISSAGSDLSALCWQAVVHLRHSSVIVIVGPEKLSLPVRNQIGLLEGDRKLTHGEVSHRARKVRLKTPLSGFGDKGCSMKIGRASCRERV